MKPGVKTSEFWGGLGLVVLNASVDYLISQGVIAADERDLILKLGAMILLALVSGVYQVSYTTSRTIVKTKTEELKG